MLVNKARISGAHILKKALLKVGELEFISREKRNINNYDMNTNISVIIPCQNGHLLVETAGLKNDLMMTFNLIGKISQENINLHLDEFYDSRYVSVGEMTRRENIVVKFTELLRLSIPDNDTYNLFGNLESRNLSHLDSICKIALNKYLCDRIFVDDQDFYKFGDLDLY